MRRTHPRLTSRPPQSHTIQVNSLSRRVRQPVEKCRKVYTGSAGGTIWHLPPFCWPPSSSSILQVEYELIGPSLVLRGFAGRQSEKETYVLDMPGVHTTVPHTYAGVG